MSRPINFCSGPAALPLPVLDRISAELHDFQGSKISVMEHSHRDQLIVRLFEDTEARLKALLGVVSLPCFISAWWSHATVLTSSYESVDGNGTAQLTLQQALGHKAIKEARSMALSKLPPPKNQIRTTIPARESWQSTGRCKIFSSVY